MYLNRLWGITTDDCDRDSGRQFDCEGFRRKGLGLCSSAILILITPSPAVVAVEQAPGPWGNKPGYIRSQDIASAVRHAYQVLRRYWPQLGR